MKNQCVNTIGILGGMGPEATNRLAHLITSLTEAERDQDHIPVITYNNAAIESRVDAILHGGQSPLAEMIRSARVLQGAGCDFLIMPCNTAHHYFDALQRAVDIPILHLIEETVSHIALQHQQASTVGVLATTATLETGLYHLSLGLQNKSVIVPHETVQASVMNALFGLQGIKAGHLEIPCETLKVAANHLIARGAQIIIAGCTEISLVLKDGDLAVPLVDPLEVIARLAVRRARLGSARARQVQAAIEQ